MNFFILLLAVVTSAALQKRSPLHEQTTLTARLLIQDLNALKSPNQISTSLARRANQPPGEQPPKRNESKAAALSSEFLGNKQSPSNTGQTSSSQSSPSQASSSKVGTKKPAFSPGFLKKGFGKELPEPTKPLAMKMSSREKPPRSFSQMQMRQRFKDLGGLTQGEYPGTTLAKVQQENVHRQQAKTKNLGREEAKLAKTANRALEYEPFSINAQRKLDQHKAASQKYQQSLTDYATAARASGNSLFHTGQIQPAVNQMKKAARADIKKHLQQKYATALGDKYGYMTGDTIRQHNVQHKPETGFEDFFFTNMAKVEAQRSARNYRSAFATKKKAFEDLSGSSSSEDERDDFKDAERGAPASF